MNKEQKNALIVDFRYSVIAELCNPYLDIRERKRLIREKAGRDYDIPFSRKNRITESCIKKWLTRYKQGGKPALEPVTRGDAGKTRCLPDKEQSILINFLELHHEITAINALRTLQRQGKIKCRISQSSLSRFIIANGLQQKDRKELKQEDVKLKFEFYKPLECIQADVCHAFPVPDHKGRRRKAMLLAFIDDATRRIIYSNFSFSENSLEFEKGLKHILMAHGAVGRVYVDNGSTFTSNQTKRILDILGISLIHSKPYRPAGRGKIERFFRTVRDQFLRVLDQEKITSVEQLNSEFKIWLEGEYHRNPHRGLQGKTPLELWLSRTHYIKPMSIDIDLDKIFLHELTRKVYQDSTLTLDGVLFQAPPILAGKSIKIRFNPHIRPVKELYLFFENKDFGTAKIVDTFGNTKVKRCMDSKTLKITNDSYENPALTVLFASNHRKENDK